MFTRLKKTFLGRPLATRAITHERLTNPQGLAIFGADALSSTAYATEEILLVLAAAGSAAFFVSIPIALVIAGLITLVSASYTQVIHAYPEGGGVYNVAQKNLGEYPALIGAASLLIDYVLTAAVSVAAGVAAVTSAFPALHDDRVYIGIIVILFLTVMNLRGVRESGRYFSIPTYLFIGVFSVMIGYGIWRHMHEAPAILDAAHTGKTLGLLGIALVFRAFASGCTAMTGIEATSNGVQNFRAPESANASKTLMCMAVILGSIFMGVTLLAHWAGAEPIPQGETIISQVARSLFGTSFAYYGVQAATAVILMLAANTPFSGFPRVASQLAKDGYFPRQFLNLGYKLVFANGIVLLAFTAAVLVYFFNGDVHALIPLYAVGVFIGFSLSQLGMVLHWTKRGWPIKKIVLNAVGLMATFSVFMVVFVSKFFHGAWMLPPVIVVLIVGMKVIKNHYDMMRRTFSLENPHRISVPPDATMVVLVKNIDAAAVYAAKVARSFNPAHIRALHVAIEASEEQALRELWQKSEVGDIQLDIVVDEYRDIIGTTLKYLRKIERRWDNDKISVVMPEIIPPSRWSFPLHNKTSWWLRMAIEDDPEIQAQIFDIPVKAAMIL